MLRTSLILGAALLVVVGLSLGFYWPFGDGNGPAQIPRSLM